MMTMISSAEMLYDNKDNAVCQVVGTMIGLVAALALAAGIAALV